MKATMEDCRILGKMKATGGNRRRRRKERLKDWDSGKAESEEED